MQSSIVDLHPTERSRVQMYGNTPTTNTRFYLPDLEKLQCTVACDKFYVLAKGRVPKPDKQHDSFESGDTAAIFQGRGGGQFESAFTLYYMGEEVGNLLAHPNPNHLMFEADHVKIELENNVLYRSDWVEIFGAIVADLSLEIRSFTQLDIAIDGLNHIVEFLNFYQRQSQENKWVRMIGAKTPKGKESLKTVSPKFSPHAFNHTTMQYENFRVGHTGMKLITCYNKSSEIRRLSSHKSYIPEFWAANGLPKDGEVWRLEMRLKSSAVKTIKDFDFTQLTQPAYLASIFRTQAHKYFDFAYVNESDTNQRRNVERIPLIPYDRLTGQLLDKSKREPSDGMYKVRMTVSGYYEKLYRGLLDDEAKASGEQLVRFYCDQYRLHDWLKLQLPKWGEKWAKLKAKSKPVTTSVFSLEDLTTIEYGT